MIASEFDSETDFDFTVFVARFRGVVDFARVVFIFVAATGATGGVLRRDLSQMMSTTISRKNKAPMPP